MNFRRFLSGLVLCGVLLLAGLPRAAWATAYVSAAAGNWSTTTNWTPNSGAGGPGNGDTVQINHAITVDAAAGAGANGIVTVGLSNTLAQAGTGTVTCSLTTVTGSGTAFTTQLRAGDIINFGTFQRTVLSIQSDSSLTIGTNTTQASAVSFTFSPRSIFVNGNSAGALTLAAGTALTVRGDCNVSKATVTLSAGSSFIFDSSAAAGTPIYSLNIAAGELSTYKSFLVCNGTLGSHCSVKIAVGSGVGRIGGAGGAAGSNNQSVNCAYTDFAKIGDAANDAIVIQPSAAGQSLKFTNCTFTTCGRIWTGSNNSVNGAADVVFTGNQWFSLPTSPQDIVTLSCFAATTGLRTITDNVMAVPDADAHLTFSSSTTGFTVQRNVFGRVDAPGTGGNFASFDTNLFYIRAINSAATNWSFVGTAGDTISNVYAINDEGPGQLGEHQVMPNDAPTGPGTIVWTGEIFERTGAVTATGVGDVIHCPSPVAGGALSFVFSLDHLLVLPRSDGQSSGHVRARGSAATLYQVTNCTLMTDVQIGGGATATDGGFLAGSSYAGSAGMVGLFRDNLCWSKAANVGALKGFAMAYDNTQGSPVADVVTTAGVANNAMYNVATGSLFDAAGANATPSLGYTTFRQNSKWTGATDILLGTGSNEGTSGPRFVDSTRCFATFDSAYLGNIVSAWISGHAYSVGDMVSAQSTGFYGNAIVNFRCVLAHTSSAGDATNGQPGAAATTGYRTDWEFASAYRIRQAIAAGTTITDSSLGLTGADYIKTALAWVRAGFAPRSGLLKNADHLGTGTPGAVPGKFGVTFRRKPGHGRTGSRTVSVAPRPLINVMDLISAH